ncbi:MAG: hypothetical protein VX228_07375, partial [Pseudomonadota bacterium]|nr:hypothetical protein [Pseudomonadota bacterium]
MTRDEISALLPFLANDTLEGAERAEVEAAVAADAALQAELTALQAIRQQMQADQEAAYSPGEVGLARLMRLVEAEGTPVQAPAQVMIADSSGVPLVSAADYGYGRVVGINDEWALYNEGTGAADIS